MNDKEVTAPAAPKPKEVPPYMTFIPSRSPSFKTHTNIGHVKNAIRSSLESWSNRSIYAYKLKDGKYEMMWEIPQNSKLEDLPWDTYIRPPYVPKPRCSHAGCACNG